MIQTEKEGTRKSARMSSSSWMKTKMKRRTKITTKAMKKKKAKGLVQAKRTKKKWCLLYLKTASLILR